MFFTREKGEQYRLQGQLRRICDLTSPNLPRLDDCRGHDRQNRTIAVLLAPWEHDGPLVSEAVTALTRDISDRGMSVTLLQPFRAAQVVVGFWLPQVLSDDPWFFLGATRQNVPIGGGFWGLGIEIERRLLLSGNAPVARLLPLITDLLPPKVVEDSPASTLIGD